MNRNEMNKSIEMKRNQINSEFMHNFVKILLNSRFLFNISFVSGPYVPMFAPTSLQFIIRKSLRGRIWIICMAKRDKE